MKSMKRKILIILLSVVMLISAAFLITLNIAIRSYVQTEAEAAIQIEKAYVSGYIDTYKDETTIKKDKTIFSASSIVMNAELLKSQKHDDMQGYYGLSQDEYKVHNYLKQNPDLINERDITSVNIEGTQYFIQPVEIKYEDGKELLGAAAIDETDGVYNDFYDIWVFYVNTSSVYKVVGLLNVVFAVVLALSMALTIFAGLRAGAMIENSELKLKRFFANASHELKTPLMSIQGYAEGLQTGVVKQDMAADVILKQSDRMSSLVEELLYISKLESGEYVLDLERVNVEELLFGCISSVEAIAAEKNLVLDVTVGKGLPSVKGDYSQLIKAVMNVLSNALRYAESKVEVKAFAAKKYVYIRISDDGCGIDIKDMPNIFKRFYKGENGNTGIGLSIAKDIITMHKGIIYTENANVGAVFTIKLRR